MTEWERTEFDRDLERVKKCLVVASRINRSYQHDFSKEAFVPINWVTTKETRQWMIDATVGIVDT